MSSTDCLPEWADGSWRAPSGELYYTVHRQNSISMYYGEEIQHVRLVGSITWYIDWAEWHPQIGNIGVTTSFRRQGVATELLRRARQIEPQLDHSWDRLSDDATKWIQAIGDRPVAT